MLYMLIHTNKVTPRLISMECKLWGKKEAYVEFEVGLGCILHIEVNESLPGEANIRVRRKVIVFRGMPSVCVEKFYN